MLRSAIRGIETEHDPSKRDREVWWRLARLACRDAVKLGQRFEKEEAEALLERLEPLPCSIYLPARQAYYIYFGQQKA